MAVSPGPLTRRTKTFPEWNPSGLHTHAVLWGKIFKTKTRLVSCFKQKWNLSTFVGDVLHFHAFLHGHEAQHREDSKPGVDTGPAVYQRHHDRVPVENIGRGQALAAKKDTERKKRKRARKKEWEDCQIGTEFQQEKERRKREREREKERKNEKDWQFKTERVSETEKWENSREKMEKKGEGRGMFVCVWREG